MTPQAYPSQQNRLRQDRLRTGTPVVPLLLALGWSALLFVHSAGFIEDDAYIHLEFARSLARGAGFSFNGHVVYGDTAPLWVWLLVLVHVAVAGWVAAAKVLGVLGLLFAGSGIYALARQITGSAWLAGWAVLAFVLNPYVAYWSFSGMETVAAAGLACWMVTLAATPPAIVAAASPAARPVGWPRLLSAALLAGLGPLLRPELLFLAAIVAGVLLYRAFHTAAAPSKRFAALLGEAVLLAGPSLAWAAYAVHTFGRVVPNTNAAKRDAPGNSVLVRLLQVYGFGYPLLLLAAALVLLLAGVWLYRRRGALARLPLAARAVPLSVWIFAAWTAVSTVFYIVNHTYVQTRYILPGASGLLVCAVGLVALARPRLLWPVLTFTLVSALVASVAYAWPNLHNKSVGDRALDGLCAWVQANLPTDAPIALYPIGQVAFVAQHPVVDTGGITRPGAIAYLNSPVQMERWLRSEGATYALAGTQPEPGAVLVYSVAKPVTGWPLNPRAYFQQDERYNLWKLPKEPQ